MAEFNRRKLLMAAGAAAGGAGLAAALPATTAYAAGRIPDDRLVRDLIASFAKADAAFSASFFATDAVWEEVPISLVLNGKQAIQNYLAQAYAETTYFYSQMGNQISFQGLVMHERVDYYNFASSPDDIAVRVMCTAVCSSGLITRLSNYYDSIQAGLNT